MNLLLVILLVYALTCLYGLKIRKEFNIKAALEVDQTTDLRGIMCLLIILHHLALSVDATGIFGFFKHVGVIAVGVFFFLSGYGIMKQSNRRGKSYLKGFIPKRVVKLLIPLAIAFTVSFFVFCMLGIREPITMFESFIKGDPFPYHTWYIWAVMILYLAFYFAGRFIEKTHLMLISLGVFSLAMMILLINLGVLNNFASSVFCFPFGCLIACRDNRMQVFLSSRRNRLIVECAVLFVTVISFFVHIYLSDVFVYTKFVLRNITDIGICLAIVLFLGHIRIGNKLLHLIGIYSFEIYLWHGSVYKLLERVDFLTKEPIIFVAVSLIACVLFGLLAGIVQKKVSGFKKIKA